MSTANTHRVVVRRKKVGGGGHHGGSWKIAYADFVTAMMAFFLVMWLISIVPKEELKGIAEYFRMPLRVALTGGPNQSAETSAIPGGGKDPTKSDGDVRKSEGKRIEVPPKPSTTEADRRDQRRLEQLRKQLVRAMESNPVLIKFRPQLLVDVTTEGLRIQIVDSKNRPMFALGSAEVEPYMRDILRQLAPMLNEVPNKISISGHTDSTPYTGDQAGYSNWELSSDRANASRQELVAAGMDPNKIIRVQGLASSMSLVKDDPSAAVNRRISLVVLNAETLRRIEEENATAADVAKGMMGASSVQQLDQALPPHAAQPPASAPAAASVIPAQH